MSAVLEASSTHNGWCAGTAVVCDLIWWCRLGFFEATAALSVLWLLVMYFNAFVSYALVGAALMRKLPSRYDGEDTRWNFANITTSCTHAATQVTMNVPNLVVLHGSGAFIRYSMRDGYFPQLPHQVNIAIMAHVFLCYVIADFVFCLLHSIGDMANIIHHILFVAFAMLVTYNCFAAYLAGGLLVMEASTIALNFYLFFRARFPEGHWFVMFWLIMTGALTIFLRLLGLLYCTYDFAMAVATNVDMPASQRDLCIILIGMAAINVLQWYWLVSLGGKMMRKLLLRFFGPKLKD